MKNGINKKRNKQELRAENLERSGLRTKEKLRHKKMKIAFVSDSIYPYNKGGKETRSYDLAVKLAERGYEVHFYTMKFWEGDDVIKKNGFYLHGICGEIPLYKGGRRNIWQGICFGFSCFKLLKEDFDVMDADHMVYFHLFPCKLACLLKRKKLIVTWHEVWGLDYWMKYMGKKGILGYMMEKLSSFLPDKIIAVSENTKKQLVENLKVPEESPRDDSGEPKIVVVENGVNVGKIKKIRASREKSDVIFAGRLLKHKNVELLIRAIGLIKKRNKGIKCIIVGDGVEMGNLRSLVGELGLEKNIIFKGFLEDINDVYGLIKSSRVFVLPSEREGFGIVVLEANACGVPIVTVNKKDNASKDLIAEGKNGFVCELNEKDLARGILKGMEKKNWDTKRYVKKYDWDRIVGKVEEAYKINNETKDRVEGVLRG